MGTIPTGKMESAMRSNYLKWVSELAVGKDLSKAVNELAGAQASIVQKYGGETARLGFKAGFPVPKALPLNFNSPSLKFVTQLQQAAIRAGIATGLNAADIGNAMFKSALDPSFRKLQLTARTEVVRAYWGNAWNQAGQYVDAGQMEMVWEAEHGPGTCKWCLDQDGKVIKDRTMLDHPNGRCTLVPKLKKPQEALDATTGMGDKDWWKLSNKEREAAMPSCVSQNLATLSPDDVSLLRRYSGSWYQSYNAVLRGEAIPGASAELLAGITKQANRLSEVLSSTEITKPISVQRKIFKRNIAKAFGEEDLNKLVGKVVTDKGAMSTTITKGGASGFKPLSGDVLLDIDCPKGTKGGWLKPVSSNKNENEVLLAPGTKLLVTGVTKDKNGVWLIKAIVKK